MGLRENETTQQTSVPEKVYSFIKTFSQDNGLRAREWQRAALSSFFDELANGDVDFLTPPRADKSKKINLLVTEGTKKDFEELAEKHGISKRVLLYTMLIRYYAKIRAQAGLEVDVPTRNTF